jgi:hypothetical protein
MARKRRTARLGVFNPFTAYLDMVQASMHATELFTASAKVIAYRSELISRAANGDLTIDQSEFVKMWVEKLAAGNESLSILLKQLKRTNPSMSPFKDMMQTWDPYRKKASANAKRLGKK